METDLQAFRDWWIAGGRKRRSANTADQMIWALRRIERSGFRLPPFMELRDARRWMAKRSSERNPRTGEPVAESTVHHEAKSLKIYSAWLAADYGEPDPLESLELPSPPMPEPQPAAQLAEVRQVLAPLEYDNSFLARRDRALIATLWVTGARRGEIVHLRVDDLHLDDKSPYAVLRRETTKAKKATREVSLVGAERPLALYLKDREWYVDRRNRNRSRRGLEPLHSDRLWLAQRGDLTVYGIGQALQARGAAVGLPQFSGHMLRRGTTEDLIESEVSESLIMQSLGWAKPDMLRRYARGRLDRIAREQIASKRKKLRL